MCPNYTELARQIRERISKCQEAVSSLYSLILYGSYVRGDFIRGVSDIDFFAVVLDKDIISVLKSILEEECKDLDAVEVDLAWEHLDNIRDPVNRGFPFKFLTIYQDDFIKHHIVIYGKDIMDLIPRYDPNRLIRWRCRITLQHLEKYMNDPKMLHILAGETARFLGWIRSRSLNKEDVLNALRDMEDHEALQIYRSYLDGRRIKFSRDYLASFIRSRVSSLTDEDRRSSHA